MDVCAFVSVTWNRTHAALVATSRYGPLITVRDLAYTTLEEAGLAELPVRSTRSKLICGCRVDQEWYRFHVPELTGRDFEAAKWRTQ